MTLFSRILGFVREVISAALFGDKAGIFDAFITAWRIPNLFRRFLGEGALSTALVTRLTEADHSEGVEAGRALFLSTVRLVAGILAVLAASCMLLAHFLPDLVSHALLIDVLGKDWNPVLELTVRVMPFVVLVCLAALFAGALQVRDRFFATMLAPVFFNAGWILALVVIGMHFGWTSPFQAAPGQAALPAPEFARQLEMTRWLAWGVLAAGVLQLACQVPALFAAGFFGGGKAAPDRAGAWRVFRTSAPLAFGAAIYQINVMVDGFMAEGLLPDGGPTAHYYANRVQQFPFALIALAAMSSIFPKLKVHGHKGEWRELTRLHDRAQFGVAFLALPASVGLFLFARPISALLFEHGAFGPEGTARVSAALSMLALALLPAGAVSLVTRAFYALDDFRTPVIVSAVLLVMNIGLNVAFVVGVGMDVEGLALATAITSWLNLVVLLPVLRRRLGRAAEATGGGLEPARGVSSLVLMLVASLAAGALARLAGMATSGAGELASLGAAALVGAGSYFALAAALRLPEWLALRERLGTRD